MKLKSRSGNDIRQSYIDFFIEKGHTFVRSSSLVPGGDSTLLFTNAGMVQFKDVFLGIDQREYSRATNSQKCLRVAGKHNDLEDVGRDDTHHTFFEMMGNWSFGDYYKKEAIAWAWELLTEVWELPKGQLFATVFEDELGEIPTDKEAAEHWREQPGFRANHLFTMGRKENFWEMGDTGPCGPCSEIHFDLRPEEGPVTNQETLNSDRFVEIWNLVFIQYNRKGPDQLDPLPNRHVDTGLGLERVVAILQGVRSNYQTDLLYPLVETTQALTGHSDRERTDHFTPYRVIADHARAAAFLVADGVVPGNLGRNYICRMIIRRAYRFGGHLGLHSPFLARIAETVIQEYQDAYPELRKNRKIILETITREEEQFQHTLEKAMLQLEDLLEKMIEQDETVLDGEKAADLYTTYGMPFEITRDIAEERGIAVNQAQFQEAMENHRLISGGGTAMGDVGGEEMEFYRQLLIKLQEEGKLDSGGVQYQPYGDLSLPGEVLALASEQETLLEAAKGEEIKVVVPQTPFYMEAGGQVSDTGHIKGKDWEIQISEIYQPAAGMIVHQGTVTRGQPAVGDPAITEVNHQRRLDIMRNHTGTHLLHAALDEVLGEHARQAGSLVAPDRLRFDFTHNEALSEEELQEIEEFVNLRILEDHPLIIRRKSLQEAVDEGARALFGEKYGEVVRTIKMGDFSYELCGGTHCERSSEVGLFLILSEGSAAAGIRRIEAVTGRKAYQLVQNRFQELNQAARYLSTSPDQVASQTKAVLDNLAKQEKIREDLQEKLAFIELNQALDEIREIHGIKLLTAILEYADLESLRVMADRFRQKYPENGVVVLAAVVQDTPKIVAAVTDNLVEKNLKAGDLVKHVAEQVGGGGGGRPTMAEAGGKDPSNLRDALASVEEWIKKQLS